MGVCETTDWEWNDCDSTAGCTRRGRTVTHTHTRHGERFKFRLNTHTHRNLGLIAVKCFATQDSRDWLNVHTHSISLGSRRLSDRGWCWHAARIDLRTEHFGGKVWLTHHDILATLDTTRVIHDSCRLFLLIVTQLQTYLVILIKTVTLTQRERSSKITQLT